MQKSALKRFFYNVFGYKPSFSCPCLLPVNSSKIIQTITKLLNNVRFIVISLVQKEQKELKRDLEVVRVSEYSNYESRLHILIEPIFDTDMVTLT